MRPRTPYRVLMKDGKELAGQTIGLAREAGSVFLYPPVDEDDRVIRMFLPREGCTAPGARSADRQGPGGTERRQHTERVSSTVAALAGQAARSKAGRDTGPAEDRDPRGAALLALEMQARMPVMRVGEALIALGLIQPAHCWTTCSRCKRSTAPVPLGELLVRPEIDLARRAVRGPCAQDGLPDRRPGAVSDRGQRIAARPLRDRGATAGVAVDVERHPPGGRDGGRDPPRRPGRARIRDPDQGGRCARCPG